MTEGALKWELQYLRYTMNVAKRWVAVAVDFRLQMLESRAGSHLVAGCEHSLVAVARSGVRMVATITFGALSAKTLRL